MRVVLDTNVLVSAFLNPDSPPGALREAIRSGRLELALSQAMLDELQRVLAYPRLRKVARFSADDAKRYCALLVESCAFFAETLSIEPVVADDPDDDAILATAVAAGADAIVSGDRHLLELESHRGIPILKPREAVELIRAADET